MIKKFVLLLISFAVLLGLTACKSELAVDNSTNKQRKHSTYVVDTSDLEVIDEKYVNYVYRCGLGCRYSWDNPNEIDPYTLFICFVFDDITKIKSTEKIVDIRHNRFYYDIDTVYDGLSKYFDFDKEILRNAWCYDEELDLIYHGGVGDVVGIYYAVTNAKQIDDILEINYEIDSYDNTIHLLGTLKVKIIDENNFKYLSYHVEDNMSKFDYKETVKPPTMTKENEENYNKYLKIFDFKSPFKYSFYEDDFKYFPTEYIYSVLNNIQTSTKIDANVVDEYLKKYFTISSEQLHSLSQTYKEEKGGGFKSSYQIPAVHPDNAFQGVVTYSWEHDNELTLNCDWYHMTSENPERYKKWGESQVRIKLDNDSWYYLSNTCNRTYNEKDVPQSIKNR